MDEMNKMAIKERLVNAKMLYQLSEKAYEDLMDVISDCIGSVHLPSVPTATDGEDLDDVICAYIQDNRHSVEAILQDLENYDTLPFT